MSCLGLGCPSYAKEQLEEQLKKAQQPNPAETKYYDSHYSAMVGFEPIEVMQQVMTYEELRGFLKGNIIKYSMRAGHKAGEDAAKDAAKAKRYAEWLSKLHYIDPDILINPKED